MGSQEFPRGFDPAAFNLALQDIDGDVAAILQKLKNSARADVVIELYSKLSPDILSTARTSLFDHAVGLYDEQLEAAGKLGKASLVLVDRRGDRRAENLSKDIISLLCYNAHLVEEFPRDVTSSKSVYVTLEIINTTPSAETQLPTNDDGTLYTNEQMIELLNKRTNEYETSVRKLWEYIFNLEKVINILQADGKQPDSSKKSTGENQHARKSQQSNQNKGAKKQGKQEESKDDEEPPSTFTQLMRNSESESSESERESDTEEEGESDREYETGAETGDDETQEQTSKSNGKSKKSDNKTQEQTSKSTENAKKSGDVKNDPWDGTAGKDGTKRLNKSKTSKKEQSNGKDKKKLSGVAQEQSVCMYVQNIKRPGNCSLGEMAQMVRSHLEGHGVRCISAQIIRNRYVEDTVGCKIIVPLRQRDNVIGIKIWPDNVRCREWAGNWDESGASIARNFGENHENSSSSSGLRGNENTRKRRGFNRRNDRHFNMNPAPWYGPYRWW